MSTEPARPLLLLVDDSPEIVLIVSRFSKDAGQEIVSCEDVAAAWQHLTGIMPALVILDLNLPGENGVVLCRKMRGDWRLAMIPIAIFSHWDRSADIAAGLAAGADFVLSKDLLCDPVAWHDRVQELLTPVDRRPYRLSLSFSEVLSGSAALPRWVEVTNHALRSPSLGFLTQDLAGVLLHRAALQAGWEIQAGWLLPGGLGLRPECVVDICRPVQLWRFALAVADQLWCVAGRAGSEPFVAILKTGITPLARALAQR